MEYNSRPGTLPMAVQVTMYLNEADRWHHRPLHIELLNYLRKENVAGAGVYHAVAGLHGTPGCARFTPGRCRWTVADCAHVYRYR